MSLNDNVEFSGSGGLLKSSSIKFSIFSEFSFDEFCDNVFFSWIYFFYRLLCQTYQELKSKMIEIRNFYFVLMAVTCKKNKCKENSKIRFSSMCPFINPGTNKQSYSNKCSHFKCHSRILQDVIWVAVWIFICQPNFEILYSTSW